jgi:uncharacterized protein YkwD
MNRQQFIGVTLTGLATMMPLGALSSGSALGQTSIDLTTFRNTALSKHNTYRTIHHSPDLTISNSANSTAQSWAEHIAATEVFEHSSSSQRNGAGENIYASYTTATSIDPDTLANDAVESWYEEVKKYNYASPGFASNTGHFTQVVWKGSTQLGCGAAQGTATIEGTKYNAFYVVCQYDPAGNMSGDFPANVSKP